MNEEVKGNRVYLPITDVVVKQVRVGAEHDITITALLMSGGLVIAEQYYYATTTKVRPDDNHFNIPADMQESIERLRIKAERVLIGKLTQKMLVLPAPKEDAQEVGGGDSQTDEEA